RLLCWRRIAGVLAYCRKNFLSQDVDLLHHLCKWHPAEINLPDVSLVAEDLVLMQELFDDLLRTSHIRNTCGIDVLSKELFGHALAIDAHHAFIDMPVSILQCLL